MNTKLSTKIILLVFFVALIVLIFFLYKPKKQEEKIEPQTTATSTMMSDIELRKEIGQMLIIGFRGTKLNQDSTIIKELGTLNIGGIILYDYDSPSGKYSRNISGFDQVKNLVSYLQANSPTPLFISTDAEGGNVLRLAPKYGFTKIPSAQSMGKMKPEQIEKISTTLSSEISSLGINMNFAPDVDVNVNPKNPVIGGLGRSFSSNPEIVTASAEAFIKGQSANKIISVIKHFPGHGSSLSDSHLGFVDITKTYKQKELVPFQKLIEKNEVDSVMTAHLVNKNIDEEFPATLSKKFITEILRNQLGFKGVIISDDMEMGAISKNYGFGESIIKSINAGVDILIVSNNIDKYDENIGQKTSDIIFNAVKNGYIPIERISDSYKKVTDLKIKYGIIK